MQLWSIWSPKGGAGKTTLALHLAGAAHAAGQTVVVIDGNADQASAHRLAEAFGKFPFDVLLGIPKEPPKADLVLIDHAPRVDPPPKAARILSPVRPAILDYQASKSAWDSPKLRDREIMRVVNQVDVRRKEQLEVANRLRNEGASVIRARSIYPRALGQGRTIHDPQLTGLHGIREARAELELLLQRMMETANELA